MLLLLIHTVQQWRHICHSVPQRVGVGHKLLVLQLSQVWSRSLLSPSISNTTQSQPFAVQPKPKREGSATAGYTHDKLQ